MRIYVSPPALLIIITIERNVNFQKIKFPFVLSWMQTFLPIILRADNLSNEVRWCSVNGCTLVICCVNILFRYDIVYIIWLSSAIGLFKGFWLFIISAIRYCILLIIQCVRFHIGQIKEESSRGRCAEHVKALREHHNMQIVFSYTLKNQQRTEEIENNHLRWCPKT